MAHRAPRVLWIGTEETRAVFTSDKPRCSPCYCQVDNIFFCYSRFYRVRLFIFIQVHINIVCKEACPFFIETMIF